MMMSVARQLTEPKVPWIRYHVLETGRAMGLYFEPLDVRLKMRGKKQTAQ